MENGFACLLQNRKSNKMLQIFSSFNFNKIDDFTFEDLNFLKSESYHLSSLFSNTFSELKDTNKALIITDRISGRTYICSDKNSSIVNIANVPLIAVVLFEQKKCLLLCYKNGKFSFVLYNDGFDRINDCIAYVFKTVTCIEKCDCCESCVVWSDGIDLHHTKIEFDFAKPCFAKLAHLLVNHNVVGIKALKKVRSGIIAVTVNNFYYHLTVNTSLKPKEISMTTDEILTKIFEGGLKIDSLNKEINTATEYLKFKEMMQTNCLPQQVELNREHEYITLKINVKEIFRKDIWRIRQRASVKNKHFVEMTDLETDMCEGMTVKIKSSLMSKNELEISLVGDFGYNFDLIIIFLGKIEVDKNNEEEEVAKTLYEIAQKRNPYFKQEK